MDWELERGKKKFGWKHHAKLNQDSTPCEDCGSRAYKHSVRGKIHPKCLRCYRQWQQENTDFSQYEGRIVTSENIRGWRGTKERKYDDAEYSRKYDK